MIENSPNSSRSLPRRRGKHVAWVLAGIVAVGTLLSGGAAVFREGCNSLAQTEIFEGITYGCRRLDATEEGSGLIHWVIVDLAAPGIELYVTPLDSTAVCAGLAMPPPPN